PFDKLEAVEPEHFDVDKTGQRQCGVFGRLVVGGCSQKCHRILRLRKGMDGIKEARALHHQSQDEKVVFVIINENEGTKRWIHLFTYLIWGRLKFKSTARHQG